jgi:cytochrome b subunit of formate dehydrogenase
MSGNKTNRRRAAAQEERTYARFTLGQRWEHAILIVSVVVLLLTGLPQKYRGMSWSQDLLSTPERLEFIRQIHHIAAVILAIEALYHLGHALYLMANRKLSSAMIPTMQDVNDAWHMLQYLLFLFFGFAIMGISGFIIWFPVFFTQFLPGGVVPAAKMAHSTESVVAAIFIIVWHLYHVHIERLNLSIFTGRLTEKEMREFHTKEYERLTGPAASDNK